MPRLKVKHEQLKQIKKQLPYLRHLFEVEEENIIPEGRYKQCTISIFKDWIYEEDYDLIFVEDVDEIQSRRNKYRNFVESLSELTDVFILAKRRSKRPSCIFKPSDVNYLIKMCEFDKLTEDRGKRYTLLIPEYSAVYQEGYDWYNNLWYRDSEKLKTLIELANKHGLHRIKDL